MSISSGVLATVAYSDIFDYPLTAREVWRFLISDTEATVEVVREQLAILTDCKRILRRSLSRARSRGSGQVCTDGEFYFLKGRENIVRFRKKRVGWVKDKWEIARRTAKKLKIIPTIKMIGVTGALAMNNCKENDDIDLLIITCTNCLWLTRLLIILFSLFLGIKRRKPKEKNTKDKICFNLFLEENHLKIEPESLFLAHEIAQVKPIFDKGGTYEKFLWENRWVSNFLPNAQNSSKFKVQSSKLERKHSISQYLNILISFFNILAFKLQYAYMKQRITYEKVSLHQAFFHPKDLSDKILKEFERKIQSLDKKTHLPL